MFRYCWIWLFTARSWYLTFSYCQILLNLLVYGQILILNIFSYCQILLNLLVNGQILILNIFSYCQILLNMLVYGQILILNIFSYCQILLNMLVYGQILILNIFSYCQILLNLLVIWRLNWRRRREKSSSMSRAGWRLLPLTSPPLSGRISPPNYSARLVV